MQEGRYDFSNSHGVSSVKQHSRFMNCQVLLFLKIDVHEKEFKRSWPASIYIYLRQHSDCLINFKMHEIKKKSIVLRAILFFFFYGRGLVFTNEPNFEQVIARN